MESAAGEAARSPVEDLAAPGRRAVAAREAIEDRVVYGAVAAGPEGPYVVTATAASPVVAHLLREAVTAEAPEGARVRVTDVVATPSGDPRGSAAGGPVRTLALRSALGLAAAPAAGRRRTTAAQAGDQAPGSP